MEPKQCELCTVDQAETVIELQCTYWRVCKRCKALAEVYEDAFEE